MTRILAIETSCDETTAAVVENGRRILSNIIASQIELHARYGGIFPEIASRAHIEAIVPVIEQAMREAHLGFDDLDAVAVTHGPGLAGSLLVGVNTAKGLALGRGLPLLGVNHLEAHIYAHWLEVEGEGGASEELEFPLLALIVSGGHTELTLMHDHGQYEYLGGTLDDAAGEAFDKVGRLLGLDYPGGPAIERASQHGDPTAFDLPRAWLGDSYNFSFSGLKTAVRRIVKAGESQLPVADLAASFQVAVVDVLVEKARRAAQEHGAEQILLSGGVAANRPLRQEMAERSDLPVLCPSISLCTDNAAMVAGAAYFRYQAGYRCGWDLDVIPNLKLTG